jgi:hypothetical protein
LKLYKHQEIFNQADEPEGKTDAFYRKYRASLKGFMPAGYPQTLAR